MKRLIYSIFLCFVLLFTSSCNINDFNLISGEVKAEISNDIIADIPVVIEKVLVKKGQKVNKNDPLVQISMEDIENQIAEKESQLKLEKLELEKIRYNETYGKSNQSISNNEKSNLMERIENLKKQLKLIQTNNTPEIRKYKSDLEKANKDYLNSKKDMELNQRLYNEGAISKSELDKSAIVVEENEKKINDIENELEAYKLNTQYQINESILALNQQLITLDKPNQASESIQIEIQNQKISILEEDIKRLQEKINNSKIRNNEITSGLNQGIINDIYVDEGTYVNKNQKILNIISLENLYIEADVPEDQIEGIVKGTEVEIIPISAKNKVLKGTIIEVSVMGGKKDGETVIPIKIKYDDPDKLLLPNYNVDVKIPTE
ncbi:HlyD family efflux transporter periplasmic adaptor subunit [Ruminiclostridium herbifermentans]|uniref:HlyD family efflux transporter periplasmic adaptor subunit n=1 Tax=Ruminiclostridium herbifermentans TaxID=2488810 RepID=A0A7H1VNW0_9FIRM|nr:HlyD family efflux transporter periplasmic adaptor subunit [Ruminiclostridium herbifermentans]QNU67072.1 HlyD family efflux transporter periplasmic adaptor subunit [Ruminiclostridium herbifermentans]